MPKTMINELNKMTIKKEDDDDGREKDYTKRT